MKVQDAVIARLRQMGLWDRITDISRRSDISDATWRALTRYDSKHALPRTEHKRREICRFLGWPEDTLEPAGLDRIRAGRQPKAGDQKPSPPPPEAAIRSVIGRLTEVLEDLALLVEEQAEGVAPSEVPPRRRRPAG